MAQIDWTKFRYMVFDIPNGSGDYLQRYQTLSMLGLHNTRQRTERVPVLENYLAALPCKYVSLAQMEVCKDIAHMETFFQSVIDEGGEGIILRDPHAPLQPGRSAGYLKHKVIPGNNKGNLLTTLSRIRNSGMPRPVLWGQLASFSGNVNCTGFRCTQLCPNKFLQAQWNPLLCTAQFLKVYGAMAAQAGRHC